jgi:hypothetical protein
MVPVVETDPSSYLMICIQFYNVCISAKLESAVQMIVDPYKPGYKKGRVSDIKAETVGSGKVKMAAKKVL